MKDGVRPPKAPLLTAREGAAPEAGEPGAVVRAEQAGAPGS